MRVIPDVRVWGYEEHGKYTIRSCYKRMMGETQLSASPCSVHPSQFSASRCSASRLLCTATTAEPATPLLIPPTQRYNDRHHRRTRFVFLLPFDFHRVFVLVPRLLQLHVFLVLFQHNIPNRVAPQANAMESSPSSTEYHHLQAKATESHIVILILNQKVPPF
nr:hypothetical protein Iba_chr01cCG4720 [Ipomoea batatas]